VERACIEAMALGRATGRPDRVADAGRTMTTYCVWHPHEPDTVLEDVVDDLRWALDHVDDADPVTRGRLQLCLALELYYVPGTEAERAALLEAGLAACRRRQDPALRAWACRTAWMTAWSPRLVETRNAWAREGLAAAREAGDEAAQAVLLTSVAVDALELADGDTWRQASAEAGRLAERHRLPYVELGLNWVWLCLASLSGDRDAVTRHHTALAENVRNVAVSLQEIHAPAARLCASLWDEEALAAIENATLDAFRDAYGATTGTHLLLARRGRGEQLVPLLDRSPLPEEPPTYWSTLTDWAQEAEAAAVAGHRRLAGQAVDALRPYAGRIGIAGMSVVLGPLDGYLALALATVGETDEAAKRADAALALAEDWGFTAYLDWLREGRKRMGF
jgi:hypothetical protein